MFEYIRGLFAEVPALAALVVAEGAESIELVAWRADRGAGEQLPRRPWRDLARRRPRRGRVSSGTRARPCADVELFRALKPALATTGGLILGISSPWAQRGFLWSKYRKHFGQRRRRPDLASRLPHDESGACPRSSSPRRWRTIPKRLPAEWLAQFRSDLEGYVSTQVLERCTEPGVTERPPQSGVSYVGFVDAASGAGKDSFAAAVAHPAVGPGDTVTVVLDAVRVVPPPFDPLDVCAEMAAFLKPYRPGVVQSDKYSGGFALEAFARAGLVARARCRTEVSAATWGAYRCSRARGSTCSTCRSCAHSSRRSNAVGARAVAMSSITRQVAMTTSRTPSQARPCLPRRRGAGTTRRSPRNVGEARRERILDERELSLFSRDG